MNFITHRDHLRKALVNCSHAVNSKNTMPILSNVLVRSVSESMIAVAATNLELGITCFVPASVSVPGAITMPSKLSVDLVNNLPSEAIHISLSHMDTNSLVIDLKCNRYDNSLMGISADDYPTLPSFRDAAVELPRSFIDAIDHVVIAAAIDDSRPVLTTVRVTISEDMIAMVCADGFRLAQTKVSLPISSAAPEPMELLIPAKTMVEVSRIMRGTTDETITMHVSENKSQVAFTSSQFEIVSRLVEGKFPDVQRVLPTEFKSEFVFKVDELQRAAKIASLINTTAGVKLILKDHQLVIISNGSQVGTAHATVDGTHTGDNHEISINVKYLQDALTAVESAGGNDAVFKSTSSTAPAILQPVNNRNYIHVMMPIMVR